MQHENLCEVAVKMAVLLCSHCDRLFRLHEVSCKFMLVCICNLCKFTLVCILDFVQVHAGVQLCLCDLICAALKSFDFHYLNAV